MADRSQEILNLCDNWYNAAMLPDGGFGIGGASEKYRLRAHNIQFHELSYKEVVASITGLSRVLLLPGLNTIIDQDHTNLWSWCAAIIVDPQTNSFSDTEREIKSLFEACIRAALAHCERPPINRAEVDRSMHIKALQPLNAREFLTHSNLILAYLSFPLLEATTKKHCGNYIDNNGLVSNSFDVVRANGYKHTYDIGKRCSSLRA